MCPEFKVHTGSGTTGKGGAQLVTVYGQVTNQTAQCSRFEEHRPSKMTRGPQPTFKTTLLLM